MDLRPIGWELAARYPHLYRDGPLPLTPRPCPICGHPTGSCTEEDHATMAGAKQAQQEAPDEVRAALQGGRMTAEEVVARDEAANPSPTLVVVKEDVYEDVHDPFAKQVRQRLKYHKGQVITEDQAKFDKVQAVQQQDVRGVKTK